MVLKADYYEAKPTDYGYIKSKDNVVQAAIEFEIQPTGEKINWTGSTVNEKSTNFVMSVLKACGYKLDSLVREFADGVKSNLLDLDSKVRVSVEVEVSKAGNEYNKIGWVGERRQKFFGQIDSNEAAKLLPLKDNKTSNVQTASTPVPSDPLDLDDIGF